jgi:hypothetical protein
VGLALLLADPAAGRQPFRGGTASSEKDDDDEARLSFASDAEDEDAAAGDMEEREEVDAAPALFYGRSILSARSEIQSGSYRTVAVLARSSGPSQEWEVREGVQYR